MLDFFKNIIMFFLSIILGAMRAVLKFVIMMAIFYGISYFGLMYYLEQNPEHKEIFEQKKESIFKMLGSFEQLLDSQSQSQEDGPESESVGGFSGLSKYLDPNMLKALIGQSGGSQAQETQIPADEVPPQLAPIDKILQASKYYSKLRPKLIAQSSGNNGAGAIKLLNKLLGSKNRDVAKAAYDSLLLINTDEAISVLRKHGY